MLKAAFLMKSENPEDEKWMELALAQAELSVGVSSPNPAVGCVLVKDGKLIGEGYHLYEQKDHAEIAALKAATESPHGSTAYVTLEPCSHTGRTGPCCDALIAAEVRRVVVATGDPNPQVRGRGIEKMQAEGIEVEIGTGQKQAQRLNEGFARWIQTGRPFVTLKAAVSLDGRIAPAEEHRDSREPWWITGEKARAEVQQMRHASDAVLTGVDTILADDSLLTDRSGLPRRRPLLRIVLDSNLRIPPDSKLFEYVADDVLIFTTSRNEERRRKLEARGARIETLSSPGNRVPLDEVFAYLGSNQILTVMTETGARLNSAMLGQGYVDRLRLFMGPLLLGDRGLPVFEGLSDPLRFAHTETISFGQDLAWECLLRDPWREAMG